MLKRGSATVRSLLASLEDNPVVILLRRRERSGPDARLGWLGRPLFLIAAYLLMLGSCYLLWEQCLLLARRSPAACNPLYVDAARLTGLNCLLIFYGAVFLLLAASRMLSGLGHGILLLSPLRGLTGGLHLAELLRDAPIADRQVLSGLLWYHLRRICAVLWVPLAVCGYGIAIFITDGHVDRGEPLLQGDLLLALALPLGAGLLLCLLASGMLMIGVFLGSRIRWPLQAHGLFWLLCLGLFQLLRLLCDFVLMFGRGLELVHTARQVWMVSAGVSVLFCLLVLRIFRELGDTAVARLPRSPAPEPSRLESGRPPREAAAPLAVIGSQVRASLLLIPLLGGLVLGGISLTYRPVVFASADPLLNWFHGYLEQSLQRQLSVVHGAVPSRLAPLSTVGQGIYWRLEPDLLDAAGKRFADDYRWHLLRMDLLTEQPAPKVIANHYGAASNRELATALLAGIVPAGVEQPDCRLVYLMRGWAYVHDLRDYYRSSHLDEAEEDPALLAELEQLLARTQEEIIALARETQQAYPLYFMALNVEHPAWDSWLEPMAEADGLPCEQLRVQGLPGLAAGFAGEQDALADPLAMALLGNQCFVNADGDLMSGNWYFRSFSYNLSLVCTPHELSHVNRFLYRCMLAEDSGPPVTSWVLDCVGMTSDWMLNDPQIDAAGLERLQQMRALVDQVDAAFIAHSWFANNATYSRRYSWMQPGGYVPEDRERYPELAELLSLGRSTAIRELESRRQYWELRNHLRLQREYRAPLEELIGMDFLGVQWERWDPGSD